MDNHEITEYWLKHYAVGFCTLCANHGVIDTRGAQTPAGIEVGRLNYCICPNGQAAREQAIDIEAYAREYMRECIWWIE